MGSVDLDTDGVNDFYYCDINTPENNGSGQLFEREREMDEQGTAYPVDLGTDREGLYDDTTRYLVWDVEDLAAIVARTAWFEANQGQWNGTTRYRVRYPDGRIQYAHDEEDAQQMARKAGIIERLYERHEGEWRAPRLIRRD
ncbi:hypothetical protein [Nocardia brasiliensis]|uniref:hypothetical protein n=1 Tax=Nocardia brasiliensis TaxID=37326 RepID=UPI002456E242|nr:hypothetical protein [Nocardia brasiliensis]